MAIRKVNVILFEASIGCNLSCIYCYNCWKAGDPYPTGRLSTLRTVKMLRKVVRESGAARVAFTGGEPLLREDLPELVFAVKAEGARASVLTNGVLLDRSWIADLRKAGVALYQLTLLGMDPAVHDLHCGEGHFEKVMAGFELLDSMRARVVGNMVVTRRNIEEIPAVMRFIAERRQPRFLLNRFNPGGNGISEDRMEELVLEREDAVRMLTHAEECAKELKIEPAASVPIPPCVIDTKRYPSVLFAGCNACSDRSYFALDPLGNVRPCNHSPQILGNVVSQPFLEIANSEASRRWRQVKPAFCEPCPGWDACMGGCRAAGQQMGLDLSSIDPWVARLLGDERLKG